MVDILMSLGDADSNGPIYFYSPYPGEYTPGFDTVGRDASFTWTNQARLGRYPAMQFTGPGEDIISIQGRLYPAIFGGLASAGLSLADGTAASGQMETLRAAGVGGKPMPLFRYGVDDGSSTYSGQFIGNYVIRRVKTDNQKFGSDGVPNRVEFTVELVLYGDDLSSDFQVLDFAANDPNVSNFLGGLSSQTLGNGSPAPSGSGPAPSTSSTTPSGNGGSQTTFSWT